MKRKYDFSKMKGRRNPYLAHLKKPMKIRLGFDIGREEYDMEGKLISSQGKLK